MPTYSASATDTLPLALLSAVAHPDLTFRHRLLRLLDSWIASRQPFYSERQVHDFLINHRTSCEPFDLDATSLALTVRLVRLLFAQRTKRHHKRWLRIVPPDREDETGGTLVRHPPLSARAARVPYTNCPPRARNGVHFYANAALQTIHDFDNPRPAIRAVCRADAGFTLEVTGPTGWPWSSTAHSPAMIGEHSVQQLGLTCEVCDNVVCLRATTPEAIIRLSAYLARGEFLALSMACGPPGHVHVLLRDFNGLEDELPAFFRLQLQSDWLTGLSWLAFPWTTRTGRPSRPGPMCRSNG